MPSNVLSIPLKVSQLGSTALSKALRSHITESFTDTHPDAFSDDLKEVAVLRDRVARMDVHTASIDGALRYHAQLVFLCSKFPSDINLSFPWSVAFPSTLPLFSTNFNLEDDSPPASPSTSSIPRRARSYMKTSGYSYTVAHSDLNYERSAVLFSLAALYSALGAGESRKEGESIKRAIAAFQISAGILHYTLTEMVPLISHLFTGINARSSDPDLKPAMLACLREAMLAQAQECFWQKAVVDRLKDGTIAKLATKVSDLYRNALDFAGNGISIEGLEGIDGDDIGCELSKEWINHMTIKRWHFAAAAQYRKSCEDLGANRYGDEIGRLRLAEANVKKALESPKKGTTDALQADLRSLQGIIATNLSRAVKDNDLIYLETVTPASSLSPIAAASMVEAKTPQEVVNPIAFLRDAPSPAYGKPLFRELVPYGVHVAISIFENRKDTFIREEIEMKRQELDNLAASALQSLNLPGSLQALDQPVNLPPSLVRKSEDVQLEGGMQRLQALSEDVTKVGRSCGEVLREITTILHQDELESTNAKQSLQMNERDDQEAVHYREKTAEFEQTMTQARQSDGLVQDKIREWQQSISILASGQDALKAYIPLQARTITLSQAQNTVVRALRVELEGLDDLIDSRATVVEEAKLLSRQHNIRPTIMREAGLIASGSRAPLIIEAAHFEPLFDKEIQPFENLKAEIDASEVSQEERLEIIRQRNEDFVESRNVDSLMQKREKALQTMDLAYSKYRELSANLVEGLEFYNSLIKLMSELRDHVKQWHQSRQLNMIELSRQMKASMISPSSISSISSSPMRPIATTAKRTTRSQAKVQPQAASASSSSQPSHQEKQQQQQQPSAPQWGAWKGGDIRFAD